MLSPSTLSHETARSPPRATHQFWVSASTRLGEGDATRVVTVLPSDSGNLFLSIIFNSFLKRYLIDKALLNRNLSKKISIVMSKFESNGIFLSQNNQQQKINKVK